jgi:hypothetical protein
MVKKINYDLQPCDQRLTENGEPRALNSAQKYVYQLIGELERKYQDLCNSYDEYPCDLGGIEEVWEMIFVDREYLTSQLSSTLEWELYNHEKDVSIWVNLEEHAILTLNIPNSTLTLNCYQETSDVHAR